MSYSTPGTPTDVIRMIRSSGSSSGRVESRSAGGAAMVPVARSSYRYSRMQLSARGYHVRARPTRVSCSMSSFAVVTSAYSAKKTFSC